MTCAKLAAINQQILLGYGFERHGKFTLGSDGLPVFNLEALPTKPFVYALAVGRRVVYISCPHNVSPRVGRLIGQPRAGSIVVPSAQR